MGRRRHPLWLLGSLAALAPAALAPTSAAQPTGPNGVEECLANIRALSIEPVSCQINHRLNPDEQAYLVRLTGGALLDAECDLAVDIGREVMASALLTPEVVEVPPQNGACRFETVATPLDVTFLLAPKVWFEEGRATRATPNIHGIRGLPAFLGDILAQAINRDPQIEAAMVAQVNALLDGLAP